MDEDLRLLPDTVIYGKVAVLGGAARAVPANPEYIDWVEGAGGALVS